MIVYAAAEDIARNLVDRVNQVILFPLITLLMTVALVVFLYGCFQYVLNANNETARSQGRQNIMYGIIGMLVMVSAFAILYIAANTFSIAIPA